MIKFVMFLQILLRLVAIPLYFAWFYFIYYMVFESFKLGAVLFGLTVVLGYVLSFINKLLSSYLVRLMLYSGCETEEDREEVRRAIKSGGR